MMTRLPRLAVAALVFTTLGFNGCSVGRDDNGNSQYTGVSSSVPASETTARDAGIAQWSISAIGPGSYVVSGIGSTGDHVAELTIGWTADRSTITVDNGHFVMGADGSIMENSIEDAEIVALFEADARAELEAQGFRLGPQCMMATQAVVTDCSKALMTNNPMDVLKCVQSIAAAMMACGGGMGGMGGMTGGGMTGGGMTNGGMTNGGMGDSGGMDDGGGYDSGGYDSGGYDSGGYDSGGYNDDGYNDDGYYYDQGAGPRVAAPSVVPDDALPSMTFGDGAPPSRLRVGKWHLPEKR